MLDDRYPDRLAWPTQVNYLYHHKPLWADPAPGHWVVWHEGLTAPPPPGSWWRLPPTHTESDHAFAASACVLSLEQWSGGAMPSGVLGVLDLGALEECGLALPYQLALGMAWLAATAHHPHRALMLTLPSEQLLAVATLRAARRLVPVVAPAPAQVQLAARPPLWNKPSPDHPEVLIRLTAELTAAHVGGAQVVFPWPLASHGGEPERLAQNLILLLQQEAYLTSLPDPAAGSYTLDHLTYELCQAAHLLYDELEAAGGLHAWLGTGKLSAWLSHSWQQRQHAYAAGEQPVLGANIYPRPGSEPVAQLHPPQPA